MSLDDDTYHRACIAAAERGTSVSALVEQFLAGLETTESRNTRLQREERELFAQIVAFDPTNRLSRDELHERNA